MLKQAKDQDKFNQQFLEIGHSSKKYGVTLDPQMHESYIREIMEKGGAPSLAELYNIAH